MDKVVHGLLAPQGEDIEAVAPAYRGGASSGCGCDWR